MPRVDTRRNTHLRPFDTNRPRLRVCCCTPWSPTEKPPSGSVGGPVTPNFLPTASSVGDVDNDAVLRIVEEIQQHSSVPVIERSTGVPLSAHKSAVRMWNNCVHECRHPLWGGAGTCHNSSGGGDTPAFCECDAGYASRDAWGNASCVPRLVLVSFYIALATQQGWLHYCGIFQDFFFFFQREVRKRFSHAIGLSFPSLQTVCLARRSSLPSPSTPVGCAEDDEPQRREV